MDTQERLDDLQFNGIKIIQNTADACLTTDAVLLANFVKIKKGALAAELGSGNGAVSLLVAAKTGARVVGIENRLSAVDLACRNAALNGMEDRVRFLCADVAEQPEPANMYDAVFANPPYFICGSGRQRPGNAASSRHEGAATLRDFVACATRLLRFGGKFFLVHRCERLAEALRLMSEYGIEPKVLTPVLAKANAEARIFLTEAKKGAKVGLRVRPFVMYREDDSYTDAALKIYGHAQKPSSDLR